MCSACSYNYDFHLPKLQKKIIYLDQCFFSHWHKGKDAKFVATGERLQALAKKQLLVCPYSDVHDKETHLGNIDGLWKFIRTISRGKQFYLQGNIKEQQLINAYISFVRSESPEYIITLSDAIAHDVHDWDESLRVDVSLSVTNFLSKQSLKTSKEEVVKSVIKILPKWRNSKTSLKEDYELEIKAHAHFLISEFREVWQSGNIQKMLESERFRIIHTMLSLDINETRATINKIDELSEANLAERCSKICSFLDSKHFRHIPHIDITASLWAILKQEIREKQFLTGNTKEEKVKENMKGILFDIEHFSIFAPYCDVVFADKAMTRWLNKISQICLGKYKFKVFPCSHNGLIEVNKYLDTIENSMSSKMKDALEFAYGNFS